MIFRFNWRHGNRYSFSQESVIPRALFSTFIRHYLFFFLLAHRSHQNNSLFFKKCFLFLRQYNFSDCFVFRYSVFYFSNGSRTMTVLVFSPRYQKQNVIAFLRLTTQKLALKRVSVIRTKQILLLTKILVDKNNGIL